MRLRWQRLPRQAHLEDTSRFRAGLVERQARWSAGRESRELFAHRPRQAAEKSRSEVFGHLPRRPRMPVTAKELPHDDAMERLCQEPAAALSFLRSVLVHGFVDERTVVLALELLLAELMSPTDGGKVHWRRGFHPEVDGVDA